MSETINEIRRRLSALEPLTLDIEDDSALHAGHEGARGGGGHYRVKIVSAAFSGLRTVARHRLVYEALGEMMRAQIHALGIEALAPDEIRI